MPGAVTYARSPDSVCRDLFDEAEVDHAVVGAMTQKATGVACQIECLPSDLKIPNGKRALLRVDSDGGRNAEVEQTTDDDVTGDEDDDLQAAEEDDDGDDAASTARSGTGREDDDRSSDGSVAPMMYVFLQNQIKRYGSEMDEVPTDASSATSTIVESDNMTPTSYSCDLTSISSLQFASDFEEESVALTRLCAFFFGFCCGSRAGQSTRANILRHARSQSAVSIAGARRRRLRAELLRAKNV